jgi:hypothetical protein
VAENTISTSCGSNFVAFVATTSGASCSGTAVTVSYTGATGSPSVGQFVDALVRFSTLGNVHLEGTITAVGSGTFTIASTTVDTYVSGGPTTAYAGAPFEWFGDANKSSVGNVLRDSLIEVSHYGFGSFWAYATRNLIIGNGIYDPGGLTVAGHGFGFSAEYNLVIESVRSGIPAIFESLFITGKNSVLSPVEGQQSYFQGGIGTGDNPSEFGGPVTLTTRQQPPEH